MKNTNLIKTAFVIVAFMIALCGRSQYVEVGSSTQKHYLTKWENTIGEYKITNANIREESSGIVIVGSVTTPFVEEEMFRVGGAIGLNATLDFKSPGSVISWGNGSDAASLNFLSKSLQPYKPVLSLDGDNGLVGIGTLNPLAKLHIKCYEGEVADIFLEPYTGDILKDNCNLEHEKTGKCLQIVCK